MSPVLVAKTWNPERLFRARRAAGLSQEALADRITELMGREARPVRARNIVRWEKPRGLNGAHAPHADFIPAIAEALERKESYFFATEDESDDDDEESEQAMASGLNLDDLLRLRIRQIVREEQGS